MQLNICPSPSADVVLTQYDDAAFPVFKAFLETLDTSCPQRSWAWDPKELSVSVVLENRSKQAITGLSYRWGAIDASGKRHDRTVSNDSYIVDVYRPVLEPGLRQLISPSKSLNESVIEHVRAGGGVIDAFVRSNINKAQPTTFEIDLIVFEDGEIAGLDPNHFAMELQCRKPAAEFVAKQIRLAATEGWEVMPVLTALAEIPSLRRPGHGKVDPLVHWIKHYARRYIRDSQPSSFDNREARLRHLENRPVLPKFFRRAQ